MFPTDNKIFLEGIGEKESVSDGFFNYKWSKKEW